MAAVVIRERSHGYAGERTHPGAGAARGSRSPTAALSEADLVTLWSGQRFPADALVTRQGVAVRVLHPGRRGRGPGPDVRGALIAAPSGAVLRGDVELHVRASDFRAHGHHTDAAYNGVVLHVVLEDDAEGDTALASGRLVPVVSLGAWLRRRAAEVASWLQSPPLWREPCVHAVERLGREAVVATLDRLGDRRHAQRASAMDEAIIARGAGEALFRALVEGVGYGSDKFAFAAVAANVSWAALAAAPGVREIEEALLTAAGPLRLFSGRPASHPERRLAGLARLLARHRRLLDGSGVAELLARPASSLVADWTVAAPSGALIGRGRAIELLVNAVLPWSAAVARAQPELAAAASERFAQLPRPAPYGALSFLETNLQAGGRPLPLNARRQQGLLALYKTECSKGGCGRCVFS